jgi:hypothetical protein
MQHVAIAWTLGSAVQYTSGNGCLDYLDNTWANQLSDHYGASRFGWTNDNILVSGTLLFLEMISKNLG